MSHLVDSIVVLMVIHWCLPKSNSRIIYPHRCGKRYRQFLLTVDDGCEIYYCADVSAIMKQQPHPPRLPPYHALPRMSHNVTNTLIVKGNNGRVWIKNEDGAWVRYRDGQQTSQEYLMSLAQEAAGPPPSDDDDTDNNNGGSIGIVIGVVIGSVASTILVGALIALLVFGIRKAKSASKSKRIHVVYYKVEIIHHQPTWSSMMRVILQLIIIAMALLTVLYS